MIPYANKIFNVIEKPYKIGKLSVYSQKDTILVFKVYIKSSKSEIKNVFKQIYPFSVIKVRTVIIKQVIHNRRHKSIKYKMWKKAYITIIHKKDK